MDTTNTDIEIAISEIKNCNYILSRDGVRINIRELRRLIKEEATQRKLRMIKTQSLSICSRYRVHHLKTYDKDI